MSFRSAQYHRCTNIAHFNNAYAVILVFKMLNVRSRTFVCAIRAHFLIIASLCLVLPVLMSFIFTCNAQTRLQRKEIKWSTFHFSHPGLLEDLSELSRIRSKIAAGEEPWASSFRKLQTTVRLPYYPQPIANVREGLNGADDQGFVQEMRDANAAYSFALLYTLTNEKAYGEAAMNILDAWSNTLRTHSGANWYLEAAWAGSTWPLAAELLRADYGTRWQNARNFGKMLNDVFLPPLHARMAFGNREFAVINALVAIGVYNDDPAAFVEGIAHFKRYAPEYYYINRDGTIPPNPDYWLFTPSDDQLLAIDAGRIPKGWTPWIVLANRHFDHTTLHNLQQGDDSTVLSRSLDTSDPLLLWGKDVGTYLSGYSPETGGRDLAHAESAFGSTINVAEIAWHQGVDLYSPYQDRLVAFMERTADLRFGSTPPLQAYSGHLKPGNGLSEVYEIAFDHYHNITGLTLPRTAALVHEVVRQTPAVAYLNGRPAGRLWHFYSPIPPLFAPRIWGFEGWITHWSTLTHGELHSQ